MVESDGRLSAYWRGDFTCYERANSISFHAQLPKSNVCKILRRELRMQGNRIRPHAMVHAADPQHHALLAMTVLERGWLSANQIVFGAPAAASAAVVDTGFCGHAAQTIALVEHALAGTPLKRIVNTHLHSDHCGGNHALQARSDVETWIPSASLAAIED